MTIAALQRAGFGALAILAVSACSSMGGLGGDSGGGLTAPVNAQGAFGQQQTGNTNAGGPTAGPNGVAELANPGATLAPNQAQYPVANGPSGLKCPPIALQGQTYACGFSFNVPPSPSPSPSGSPASDASSAPTPSPTPTPPGTITLQAEALPSDVPGMTQPDLQALRIAPVLAIRFQSDTNFEMNGTAIAAYTLPRAQFAGRRFALQLYNETFPRTVSGTKRTDTFLLGYAKPVVDADDAMLSFTFSLPKTSVRSGQIWLLVLYGLTYPSTPSPSPSPAASSSASASPSPQPT
jgi:hypothetical protein